MDPSRGGGKGVIVDATGGSVSSLISPSLTLANTITDSGSRSCEEGLLAGREEGNCYRLPLGHLTALSHLGWHSIETCYISEMERMEFLTFYWN